MPDPLCPRCLQVTLLKQVGFDHAFNYKTTDTGVALAEAAPDGIDIYFDNVGGATLEAALTASRNFGRIVACGQISTYDAPEEKRYGVRNLFYVRLLWQGTPRPTAAAAHLNSTTLPPSLRGCSQAAPRCAAQMLVGETGQALSLNGHVLSCDFLPACSCPYPLMCSHPADCDKAVEDAGLHRG